jgi:Domain of unknown function (DUF4136)
MSNRSRLARLAVAVFGVFAMGVGAAVAQDVSVNYTPGTDFFKYTTYRWVDVPGAEKPDAIIDGQIRQAVETVLAGKGLKKVEGDEATLLVAYQLALTQERQVNAYSSGGYGYGWRYGGGMSTTTATTTTINIGTIALDMYDPALKELVWRGQASKTVDAKAKPEKRQKNLEKAMSKLLKDFRKPPKT